MWNHVIQIMMLKKENGAEILDTSHSARIPISANEIKLQWIRYFFSATEVFLRRSFSICFARHFHFVFQIHVFRVSFFFFLSPFCLLLDSYSMHGVQNVVTIRMSIPKSNLTLCLEAMERYWANTPYKGKSTGGTCVTVALCNMHW